MPWPTTRRLIGTKVQRIDGNEKSTGRAKYSFDINRPRMMHARMLRSPHAHATIKSINTAKAAKMPGVVGIFTGEDVANDKLGGLICGWMIHSKDGSPMKAGPHPVLALGKVRFVGDQVALVVAETREQAKAGSPRWPQRHGFIAAISWTRAGNVTWALARATVTVPVSSGCRSESRTTR